MAVDDEDGLPDVERRAPEDGRSNDRPIGILTLLDAVF